MMAIKLKIMIWIICAFPLAFLAHILYTFLFGVKSARARVINYNFYAHK